jgi:PRC-barrel domain
MASPIEDMSSLPGQTVSDQEGVDIGKVKDVYAVNDDAPMWVTIEASTGMAGSKVVFVPIARLKEEDGNLSVPYSAQRIKEAPEVEQEDELSEEDDRMLRDYYAIDHADQEFRTEGESYASKVPDAEEPPRKISAEDASEPQGGQPGGADDEDSSDQDADGKSEGADDEGSSDQDSDGKSEGSDGESSEARSSEEK